MSELSLSLSIPTAICADAQVRLAGTRDEPLFCLVDLCQALEIGNPSMVAARLDDDEKGISLTDTLGGKQALIYVTEPGLYKVIVRSDKPAAKAFTRWVMHEVLPAIRRTGSYPPAPPIPAALPGKPALLDAKTAPALLRAVKSVLTLGGLDDRDALLLKDLARDVALIVTGRQSQPVNAVAVVISNRVRQLGHTGHFSEAIIGKRIKARYIAKNGMPPPLRVQFVDGAPREVCHYTTADIDVVDAGIADYFGAPTETIA